MRLTEKQLELFEDTDSGGFFSTAADDHRLVLRVKEDYDGAEPSGNSVAVMNLVRLAQMTNRAAFRESAERGARRLRQPPSVAPVAIPQMLTACEFLLGEPREIILVGRLDSRGNAGPAARTAHSLRPQPRGAAGGFSGGPASTCPRAFPRVESMHPAGWTCERVRLPQLHLPVARFRTG